MLLDKKSSKPIVVIGAGGHAKVVAEALISSGRKILGFVSPDKPRDSPFFGSTILGDDHIFEKFSPDRIELANGVGALPFQNIRWELVKKFEMQGYYFTKVIHPSAEISANVNISHGAQIMAGAVLQPGSQVGGNSIINTGVLLDHDCYVGHNCHLAPGVVCCGGVTIEEGVNIGAGTVVIQYIRIGSNTVVSAGTTVLHDIPRTMVMKEIKEITIEKRRT